MQVILDLIRHLMQSALSPAQENWLMAIWQVPWP